LNKHGFIIGLALLAGYKKLHLILIGIIYSSHLDDNEKQMLVVSLLVIDL